MKSALLAAAAALALSTGVAFAQAGGGGGGGGNPAISNSTGTSMGAPAGSPEYAAPRSAVVPGLPAQSREAQQDNAAGGRQVDQGVASPVQGPTNPVTGHTQVTR
ncbi:MAG TPA: hypothetical protein VJ779_05415 [Acetobacteraceae bacterium]|nr:hypothetical protein [Acetobacteraceae bacterium]